VVSLFIGGLSIETETKTLEKLFKKKGIAVADVRKIPGKR
jgi:hypothetical protein